MFNSWSQQVKKAPLCCESVPPVSVLLFSGEAARWSQTGLTATALSILLQQLPFRTDAVVRSRSAHALVLAAVLHRVTQVHVCKHRKRIRTHVQTDGGKKENVFVQDMN